MFVVLLSCVVSACTAAREQAVLIQTPAPVAISAETQAQLRTAMDQLEAGQALDQLQRQALLRALEALFVEREKLRLLRRQASSQ